MDDHLQTEVAGDVHGLVVRDVIDEDDPVDAVVRDVGVRALERQRGVVRGHDDDDARFGSGLGHGAKGSGSPATLEGAATGEVAS